MKTPNSKFQTPNSKVLISISNPKFQALWKPQFLISISPKYQNPKICSTAESNKAQTQNKSAQIDEKNPPKSTQIDEKNRTIEAYQTTGGRWGRADLLREDEGADDERNRWGAGCRWGRPGCSWRRAGRRDEDEEDDVREEDVDDTLS